MDWIDPTVELPSEGEHVLIHLKKGGYHTASLRRGISLEDRRKMKSGEIKDVVIFEDWSTPENPFIYTNPVNRSSLRILGDEDERNTVPYIWLDLPCRYYGQDVDYWMRFPEVPVLVHHAGSIG